MAVDKLFWRDPYLTGNDAVVTGVDGSEVTLDRSVAFAFSGGQQSDRGTIGGHEIVEARILGHEIVYVLPPGHGLAVGDPVRVEIDWDERYRVMRLHFAAEMVLELVTQLFDGPEKVGANITADKARVDFRWDGRIDETFPVLSERIARLVADDLEIVCGFSDVANGRRFWRVEGLATVPCGGTHPRRTGEIGGIGLKRTNPGGGKERIEIRLAG